MIGKLLYLEKSTRPDISCAVHQCARHCARPKVQHTIAVKRIGRYLLATKDKGLIMRPNQEGMECWVDAAHATEWNNKTASDANSEELSSESTTKLPSSESNLTTLGLAQPVWCAKTSDTASSSHVTMTAFIMHNRRSTNAVPEVI